METIIQLLGRIFAFLAGLFTEPEAAGNKTSSRKKRSPKTYAALLITVVVLLYVCLSIPMAMLFLGAKAENSKLNVEIAELKKRLDSAEKLAVENFAKGKESAMMTLIKNEFVACQKAFQAILARIENDPRWPGLGQGARNEATSSIKIHQNSIEEHLDAIYMFESRLNGSMPAAHQKEHEKILTSLKEFRDRVMPQLRRVTGQEALRGDVDLTLLKAEVIKALHDLINELRLATPQDQLWGE